MQVSGIDPLPLRPCGLRLCLLEHRLDDLIHKISEIKKQLFLEKLSKRKNSTDKMKRWKTLGAEISLKWCGLSAVEEIRLQREKS